MIPHAIKKLQYFTMALDLALRLAVSIIAKDNRARNPRIFMILVDFPKIFLQNLPLSRRLKTEMDKIMITV